jgi:hypothetical protein
LSITCNQQRLEQFYNLHQFLANNLDLVPKNKRQVVDLAPAIKHILLKKLQARLKPLGVNATFSTTDNRLSFHINNLGTRIPSLAKLFHCYGGSELEHQLAAPLVEKYRRLDQAIKNLYGPEVENLFKLDVGRHNFVRVSYGPNLFANTDTALEILSQLLIQNHVLDDETAGLANLLIFLYETIGSRSGQDLFELSCADRDLLASLNDLFLVRKLSSNLMYPIAEILATVDNLVRDDHQIRLMASQLAVIGEVYRQPGQSLLREDPSPPVLQAYTYDPSRVTEQPVIATVPVQLEIPTPVPAAEVPDQSGMYDRFAQEMAEICQVINSRGNRSDTVILDDLAEPEPPSPVTVSNSSAWATATIEIPASQIMPNRNAEEYVFTDEVGPADIEPLRVSRTMSMNDLPISLMEWGPVTASSRPTVLLPELDRSDRLSRPFAEHAAEYENYYMPEPRVLPDLRRASQATAGWIGQETPVTLTERFREAVEAMETAEPLPPIFLDSIPRLVLREEPAIVATVRPTLTIN